MKVLCFTYTPIDLWRTNTGRAYISLLNRPCAD